MDKQYKYTLRKTTLGLASVAIAAFLAGQSPIIQAAEAENATNTEALPSEINEAESATNTEALPSEINEAESATNTEMLPAEIHEEEMINVSEVIAPQPVAAQESTELNYSDEEKNIKDYSNSERYKETDLTPGSTVVQNSNTDEGVVKDGTKFHIRQEYHAEVGYQEDTLTNTPESLQAKEDTKKNLPVSYELVQGTYKDSSGNVWDNVTIDPETGVVTAVVPEHAYIKGGENLFVDVKVHYVDEDGTNSEETIKAQFIARPRYKEEVTKEFTSQIPFETKVIYDETLEEGKVVKTDGFVGESKTTFKQVVINGEKGIINEAGEFVKGEEVVEVTTVREKQDAEIRIGTKPAETTVEIPRGLEYELDYTRKAGNPEIVEEGNDGVVTITTTRNPETGEITVTKTVTTEAKNRKIKIPAKTEGTVVDEDEIPFGYTVEFDPDFYTNYPDATDNYKIVKDGVAGTNKKTWTIVNSKIVGEYELEETEPINAIIKVGQKDYTGIDNNPVKVVVNPNLEAGKINVKPEYNSGSMTWEIVYEYGSKTTGEVKVQSEIPYEVEIIEDDTMDAGTHKVVQEGKVGEKETTILIENSVEESRSDKYTKEAVKKIIRVGTKPNDKMCPIPVETENPEVPNEPGKPGEDSKDPDKPGEKDFEGPSIPDEDKSNEPGKLGEDLKDPGDPTKPNKQDSKDPSESGSNKPSSNNPTEKSNTSSADSATQVDKAGVLPETGETSATLTFGAAALSFLSGLRLVATKGRKEEE